MTSISIVIEGAGGVGKSALTTKYVNGTFLSRVCFSFNSFNLLF